MTIRICHNEEEWEAGRRTHGSEFLQSWEWGEFQRSIGHEPIRLQMMEGEKVVGQVQGFVHRLPLGLKYLYVPRYAIGDRRYIELLSEHVKKDGYVFVRLEPTSPLSVVHSPLSVVRNRQPQHTLLLDLTQSQEELLAAMHPKTRYNIHVAERKGILIRTEKNSDIFWRLNEETTTRDHFKSHDRRYYEKMLSLPICHQLTAYLDNQPIASNLLIISGETCAYLHGAAGNRAREAMAPYLLQWQGMLLGKNLGCRTYDFWGVTPPSQKSKVNHRQWAGSRPRRENQKSVETCFHNYCWETTHPWTGVTRFKAGFGGAPRSYPQAMDILFQPLMYRLYKLARRGRGICTAFGS